MRKIFNGLVLVFVFLVSTGFNLSTHSVPISEIRSGGPPKDGIPAIIKPVFVKADKAAFMSDSDRVLGVAVLGEVKAYPVKILNWHEAVNDRINGYAILATW